MKSDRIKDISSNARKAFFERVSALIVRGRIVIFVLFAVSCVLCLFTLGKVRINSDLTSFLPPETETRRALAVMSEEFETYASANVMICGVTYDEASDLLNEISGGDHVASFSFDDSEAHYKDGNALFSVAFDVRSDDPEAIRTMDEIKEKLSGFETYISSSVGQDFSEHLAKEMVGVIIIAAAVIFAVLLFTSRSYFEVVIYAVVFVVAALLNMGTNYWFGEISSITNSVAIILQLALAIDYAIIFAHRYHDEAEKPGSKRGALVSSLAHSIVEISSSSLTTISGLIALTLMQFRLGFDLGVVLAKGIVCSMLTVIFLMPGLISLFPKLILKTSHKNLVPSIEKWGRFLAKNSLLFVIIFSLVVPAAIVFSSKADYAFSDSSITELVRSETRDAMHKINDTFEPSTSVALLVPSGNYEKERLLLDEVSSIENVKSAMGIAGVMIDETHSLTDKVTPKEITDYLNIAPEQVELLYKAYSFEKEGDVTAFSKDQSGKKIPLVDLVIYLFEKIDDGAVSLTEDQEDMVSAVRPKLEFAAAQLKGDRYDRIVISASLPAEGEKSTALLEKIKSAAEKYYGDEALAAGDITSAKDLRDSYKSDSVLISILTIVFVFLILLFTFRSPVAAALLVIVIQGSIWINFSIPYFLGINCSFVTHMIVCAIQMGATIDYAIVILNRYLLLRSNHDKKEAAALAVKESFPTVITSGAIMAAAGLLIAFRVSDVYVGHIGFAVGRGALISVILVLTALPQLILLFDKAIEKTTIQKSKIKMFKCNKS